MLNNFCFKSKLSPNLIISSLWKGPSNITAYKIFELEIIIKK